MTGRHQIDGREYYALEEAYLVAAHPQARLIVRTVPTPLDPRDGHVWKARQRACR